MLNNLHPFSQVHVISSIKCSKATLSALLFCVFATIAAPTVVKAQPHDPVEELFRFGTGDHLIIDRGGPVDGAGDVNGDGIDDIMIGSGAGGVRVIFGPTRGNNGTLNGQQINGVSGFNIRHDSSSVSVVAGIGDLNGDGFDDVAVGSANGGHVVFGKSGRFDRFVEIDSFNGNNGFTFNSPITAVSSAGDINGDGIVDLLFGNSKASANDLTGVGATYVIYGKRGAFPKRMEPGSLAGGAGFVVLGTNKEDRSGRHVGSAGDFNNDGVDDFMIGAPNKTQYGLAEVGEAYVIYGRKDGFPATISLSDINGANGLVFKGSHIQDAAGSQVTGIGDINYDGIDDIAISAPGKGPFGSPSNYPGETYVLFGGRFEGALNLNEESLNGSNGFVARGIRGGVIPIEKGQAIWGDLAGTSVDGAGDYNDDGVDDLIIGASHTIRSPSRKGVGQIYIIYGRIDGFPARLNLADLDGDNGFRVDGIGTVDYFGVSVRGAGDFNDDGRDDVVVGASGQGNSYVIYGRDPWAYQRPPPQPAPLSGAVSPGFPETAFIRQADAGRLPFKELADPTGSDPIPPSASSVLGDPATPNNIPPNLLDPVAPLRPSDLVPEPEVVVPEVVVPPQVIEPSNPSETPDIAVDVADVDPTQPTPTVEPSEVNPPNPVAPSANLPVRPMPPKQPEPIDDGSDVNSNDSVRVGVGAVSQDPLLVLFLLLFVRAGFIHYGWRILPS